MYRNKLFLWILLLVRTLLWYFAHATTAKMSLFVKNSAKRHSTEIGDRKTNPQYNVNYSGNIHRQLGPSSFIDNWQSVINHCITFAKTTCHIAVRALFTNYKQSDILPPNLMKSRCREIGCDNELIVLEFDRHLDSSAAEVPVKFPSD